MASYYNTKDEPGDCLGSNFTAEKAAKGIESFKEFFGIVTNIRTDVGDHDMDKYESLVEQGVTTLQGLFP